MSLSVKMGSVVDSSYSRSRVSPLTNILDRNPSSAPVVLVPTYTLWFAAAIAVVTLMVPAN